MTIISSLLNSIISHMTLHVVLRPNRPCLYIHNVNINVRYEKQELVLLYRLQNSYKGRNNQIFVSNLCQKVSLDTSLRFTFDIRLSAPVPSSSLYSISALLFWGRSSSKLGSSLLILPSGGPLAPRVFSDTLGTRWRNCSGVDWRGPFDCLLDLPVQAWVLLNRRQGSRKKRIGRSRE